MADKEKQNELNQKFGQLEFDFGISRPIPDKGSDNPKRGDNNNPRQPVKRESKDLWETECDTGFVKTFARQISFSGVEYFYSILLPADSHLWPKLPTRREKGQKSH